MGDRSLPRRWWIAVALAIPVLVYLIAVEVFELLRDRDRFLRPGSPTYQQMVSAFYSGLAALDVDATDHAREALTRATQVVPEEPAAWADRGLLHIRLGDFDAA